MAVGDTFKKKYGPLPLWAWMGLGLGVALALSVWNRNKNATGDSDEAPADPIDYELPGNLPPSWAFPINTTIINTPPAGGRDGPPGPGGPPGPPGPGGPPGVPVPQPAPVPLPTPKPVPKPPPPGPVAKGRWVLVAQYKEPKPVWNSTLWGIAENSYGKGGKYGTGGGKAWPTIWNAPQNSALKKLRGAPEKIRAGDKIWVPQL